MSEQIDTLKLIFEKLNQIYEKLCERDEGVDKQYTVQFGDFFNDQGDLLLPTVEDVGNTAPSAEDVAFVSRLERDFKGVIQALAEYANTDSGDWG